MVDVRVREQREVDRAGGDGQALVHEHIAPLLHAAVDDKAGRAALDIGAAPRDLVRRAEEGDSHLVLLSSGGGIRLLRRADAAAETN